MESIWWYLIILAVCYGFFCTYLYFFIEDAGEKWWEPVAMAVVFPMYWFYKNWIPIVGWIVFFIVLFGVPVLIGIGVQFIAQAL